MEISNEEANRIAADDLRKMEYDIIGEAEASVEDYDAMGAEGAAAAAAETAAEFDEAIRATEKVQKESEA